MLIYTFRTVDVCDQLEDDVFIFHKLRADLDHFLQRVITEKPNTILGIGNARFTRFESQAVNRLHGKKIIQAGPTSYDLYVPQGAQNNTDSTESFCNWTAYRIANFIADNKLTIQLSFLHIKKDDMSILSSEVNKLYFRV